MGVMAKAIWENTVLAESDKTIEVEGNQYFPPDAIKSEYFQPSDQHTTCPWKGLAMLLQRGCEWKAQRQCCLVLP